MVSFDHREPGTSELRWTADGRLASRPALSLDEIDALLVIAAHPDDETLGAGGLIAACAARGLPVRVVVVTDGAGASGHPDAGLVARRSAELAAAVAELAPDAVIDELGFADGGTLEDRDAIRDALLPLLADAGPRTAVAAPWRGDGHRDHRVVGEVVAELADGAVLLEYPIWMWHWASPDDAVVPWPRMVSLAVDLETKARAVARFPSQTEGAEPQLGPHVLTRFARERELFIVETPIIGESYFDDMLERRDDPWGFESRWYERRKRALTLASLPDERYGTALEIGCSIGVLTADLAVRCDDLLAVDISGRAVDRARIRVDGAARIEHRNAVVDFPEGAFDLIVLSEMGYYCSEGDLEQLLDSMLAALAPGGSILACHWRHPLDDGPLTGDRVHAALAMRDLPLIVQHAEDDILIDIYSPDDRSVAGRTGLL